MHPPLLFSDCTVCPEKKFPNPRPLREGCENWLFVAGCPPSAAAACTSLEKSAPRRQRSSSRSHFQFSTPSALEECFTAKTYTKKDSGLEARRFAKVGIAIQDSPPMNRRWLICGLANRLASTQDASEQQDEAADKEIF